MNTSIKKNLVFGTLLLGATTIHAQVIKQKVGDNPTVISASTVLEVESTNKGVLLPRISLTSATDATTISSPATSLLIYNTATAGTSPNDVAPGFYYWSGTRWNKLSVGSETDPVIGNEILDAVANGGLTRTGSGTAADPYKIKMTDGSANGQVLTWDGTKWTATAVGAEVDGVIGNEVTDVVANKGLTRTGTGTAADPYKVQMTDGTAANQTMVWNGTTWAPATTPEVDGIIGNEVLNATTNKGLTRAGSGTAASPYTLGLTDGTAANQTMVWDGTTWAPATTPEVDGIIGNEVTDAVANGGLTRTGTGTAANPYKLKINDGSANGQVLTWDGTKWVATAASNDWHLDGNAGVDATNSFLGTIQSEDLVIKTSSTERMRVDRVGHVGIGDTVVDIPNTLDVRGSFGLSTINVTSDIALNFTHAIVRIDATTANVNVTLPAANIATGRIYSVVKSDSSTNKLIFNQTIQGNGFTFTQANVPGEYKIQSNGTNWYLLN